MKYPQITEYKSAIQIAENFDRLKHLRPRLDVRRQPIFAAGGPAVVFKMYDTKGKNYALKLFLKEQPRRAENFMAINNYIKNLGPNPYITNYNYYPEELWIDGIEYPVLVMDWIDGVTMSKTVSDLCEKGDKEALSILASKFDRMALWLLSQKMSHGDLKPDNIIVTQSGELKLIDYDGMYVPDFSGTLSLELGTAEYRHPQRTPKDFNRSLDDFPILVLSLSLHALAISPHLYDKTIHGDALLFVKEDYDNILVCKNINFFQNNSSHTVFSRFGMLMSSLYQSVIGLQGLEKILEETASEELISLDVRDRAGKSEIVNITRSNTIIELINNTFSEGTDGEWFDESLVMYSSNRKKLIRNFGDVEFYTVPDGAEVICNNAFHDSENLKMIFFSDTVLSVGEHAFSYCDNLISVDISASVNYIHNTAFESCHNLKVVKIPRNSSRLKEMLSGIVDSSVIVEV